MNQRLIKLLQMNDGSGSDLCGNCEAESSKPHPSSVFIMVVFN